jgi:hypothetical protein
MAHPILPVFASEHVGELSASLKLFQCPLGASINMYAGSKGKDKTP